MGSIQRLALPVAHCPTHRYRRNGLPVRGTQAMYPITACPCLARVYAAALRATWIDVHLDLDDHAWHLVTHWHKACRRRALAAGLEAIDVDLASMAGCCDGRNEQ